MSFYQVFGSPTPIAGWHEFQDAIRKWFAPGIIEHDTFRPLLYHDVAAGHVPADLRLYYGTWQNVSSIQLLCDISRTASYAEIWNWWLWSVLGRNWLPDDSYALNAYAAIGGFAVMTYGPPAWSVNVSVTPGQGAELTIGMTVVPAPGNEDQTVFNEVQTRSDFIRMPWGDLESAGAFRPLEAPVASASSRYTAIFEDAGGRTVPVPFTCKNDAAAKSIANAIAGSSSARWTDLRRAALVSVPIIDATGAPLETRYRQPAGPGSDVQRVARLRYDAAAAGDVVRVELPSVDVDLVSRGSERSDADPLDDTTRPMLLTEAGSPATSFRGAKFRRSLRGGA